MRVGSGWMTGGIVRSQRLVDLMATVATSSGREAVTLLGPPRALFTLEPLARGAGDAEKAAHDKRSAELARYKLGPITADDADDFHRVACPAGRLDGRQFGLKLFDGAAGLGQLVDLDALGARLQVGIDEGLIPPAMKGRFGAPGLIRDFADPFTARPGVHRWCAETLSHSARAWHLQVAHDQTLISPDR